MCYGRFAANLRKARDGRGELSVGDGAVMHLHRLLAAVLRLEHAMDARLLDL
jgi:hypothetical protein